MKLHRKAEYRYNGVGQNIWRTGGKSANIARELIDVPTPEKPEENFGILDNLLLTEERLNGGNNKNKEIKE